MPLMLLATLCGGCEPTEPAQAQPPTTVAEAPYEDVIRRFERRDERRPPAPGGVLFVGSSSIRLWKTLQTDMAPMHVINRGFGGSTTADVLRYVDRVVLPYRPRAIVYYAGDNDIGRDRQSPTQVADGFRRFVDVVAATGRQTDIYFVSIKPSPRRMKRWPQMHEANALVRSYARSAPHVSYIDVASHLLGPDGRPRARYYAKDGVHMVDAGYRVWTRIIKPAVMTQLAPDPLYL